MKRILVALAACLPLAAIASPQGAGPGPGAGPGGEGSEHHRAHMMKRMRVAFAVGYAEALDLGEAEALKARDVVARFEERRAAVRKQMQEQVQVVRQAAKGDAAAGKALDGALQKLRETRGQMMAIHDEMFQALTQGLTPERKAKAAVFLTRFRARMSGGMGHMRERVIEMRRGMPGGPGGRGGPGGPGGGGMGPGPRMGSGGPGFQAPGDMPGDDMEIEIYSDDEPI